MIFFLNCFLSSEEAGNRKLLDMGQEIGSKSGILYGLEIVNNYVIGGDNRFRKKGF